MYNNCTCASFYLAIFTLLLGLSVCQSMFYLHILVITGLHVHVCLILGEVHGTCIAIMQTSVA